MRRWLGRRHGDAELGNRSEAFRVLRANLEVTLLDLERPSVVVTSAHAGEGKTSVCAQLGRSFADAGRRVVLVDLDLRKPELHRWFDADNLQGVSDVLTERCTLEEAVRFVDLPTIDGDAPHGLYLLAAGSAVPNPAELVGSARTGRLLDALSGQADVLLVDTPPVLPVADTLVIARTVAGAVLVVGPDTPVDAARGAKDALVRNHARVLGAVLNRFDTGRLGYGRAAYGTDDSTAGDRAG